MKSAPERSTYRLNQYISRCGIASRRKAEELIALGEVRVNDKVVDHPSLQIDPGKDTVKVRGQVIHLPSLETVVFYKPKGVVCTRKDPEGRRTIYDLLPTSLAKKGVQSVGRLDFESTGLLVLTNDGDLHQAMEHPSNKVRRTYKVKARGILDNTKKEILLKGVPLDEGPAKAEEVEVVRISGGISRIEITLTEGRNREVRRLLAAIGLEVLDLKRVRYGAVILEGLLPGKWRDPTFREQTFFEKIKRRATRGSSQG